MATVEGLFSVSVGPSSGSTGVQEVSFFDAVRVTFNFDQGDQIAFTVPSYAPEAVYLDELATDVWLDGAVRQRFRVVSLDQVWGEDGGSLIAVNAVSYKRLLAARFLRTALDFVNIEQGDIIWGLIQHTQAGTGGNWGVTKGATTTGQLRERHYLVGENIADLAIKLSQVINGCWFNIDADLVFTARLPTSFPLKGTPLQVGVTARTLSRKGGSDKFANVVLASGDNQATVPVIVEAAGLATDPRGRWERTTSHPSTIVQASLTEAAQGDVQAAQNPPATWTAALEPSRWLLDATVMPGDLVVALVPADLAAPIGGPIPASGYVTQVIELQANFTADGELQLGMTAVEVSPWTFAGGSARVGIARVDHALVGNSSSTP